MLTLIEASLLAAALFPLVRLYAVKGFRHRLTALSRINLFILGFIAGWLALILTLAVFVPLALHPLLFLGSLVYLVLYWRARPAYGKNQGLAPGSLALLPVGQWNDPAYYTKRFQTYGPIFKSSDLYRPSVNLLGIERARAFLTQHADAVRVPAFPFNRFIPNSMLRFAAPAYHNVARPLFQSIFNSSLLHDTETELTHSIRCDLAAMTSASQNAPDGIHPYPYFLSLLDNALLRLFFGLTPASAIYPRWHALCQVIAIRSASRVSDAQVRSGLAEMMQILQTHITSHDAPPSFAAALTRLKPDALSDPSYLYNLIYIYQVGRGDMTGLFLWLFKMLSDNPIWLTRLRAPDAPAPSRFVANLSARIVRETLRLQQSEFLLRQTTRDIQFENYNIPTGWYVRMCIKESHHLSDAFENAEHFDPDRFLSHRYTRAQYMPFGTFNKSCLGEHITLSLAKMFVTEIARNHTWHILADGPQEFNGFHWQPSTNLRIRLL